MPGDYSSYVKYSGWMFDIVRRYIPDVEEYSIDECFADMTGWDKPLKMSYRQIAELIKDEITNELDLSVSVGVGPSKVLAKVASKWVKPNGLTIIPTTNISDFLSNVSIEKVWGIGRQTSLFLKKKGIKTAGEFAEQKREWIMENLAKPYQTIWHELNGTAILEIDPRPKTFYSSVQKTGTFRPPTADKVFLMAQLSKHIEDACAKVRYYSLIPRGISFFLKTQDFRYANRSINLPLPTNAPEILIPLVRREFEKMNFTDYVYRASGVSLHGLMPISTSQEDLFGDRNKAKKFEEIHKRIDILEEKYKKRLVHLTSTHVAFDEADEIDDLDRNLLFL